MSCVGLLPPKPIIYPWIEAEHPFWLQGLKYRVKAFRYLSIKDEHKRGKKKHEDSFLCFCNLTLFLETHMHTI